MAETKTPGPDMADITLYIFFIQVKIKLFIKHNNICKMYIYLIYFNKKNEIITTISLSSSRANVWNN